MKEGSRVQSPQPRSPNVLPQYAGVILGRPIAMYPRTKLRAQLEFQPLFIASAMASQARIRSFPRREKKEPGGDGLLGVYKPSDLPSRVSGRHDDADPIICF